LKLIAVAVVVGFVLTAAPFVVPLPMKALSFVHWPLLFADRQFNSLIPLNAGKRMITLFRTNVAVLALLSILLFGSYRKAGRKGIF